MNSRLQTGLTWAFTFGLCAVMLSAAMWQMNWIVSPLAMR